VIGVAPALFARVEAAITVYSAAPSTTRNSPRARPVGAANMYALQRTHIAGRIAKSAAPTSGAILGTLMGHS
jgi:hypothetical protein